MSEERLAALPGVLPEGKSVTGKGQICHLNETSVTERKVNVNSNLTEACHRSISTVLDSVTSEKTGGKTKQSQGGGTVSPHEATASDAEWRLDCLKLSATKLKERYPGTYSAFHAMMYVRARPIAQGGEGADIHESVRTLAKFMRALGGPRRHPDMTVERLDYLDPEYAADKIVWADKRGQARNRETNSIVTNPQTGEKATVAEVAEHLGLKANTITKALKRAIEKNPDREAEIRQTIVAKYLEKHLAKHPGHTVSAAPAAPEEGPPVSEPYTRRTQPHDWKKRWPVEMSKEKRDLWNQRFKAERKTLNSDGELEWRHEFYIRILRATLIGGGFGGKLVGCGPSSTGTLLDRMRDAWADPEEPNTDEWTAFSERKALYDLCFSRLQEALAAMPEFEAVARYSRRAKDRRFGQSYSHSQSSNDYEDQEMKDAEEYGSDEVEVEAVPDARSGREERFEDSAARRRGMEL